jgi:hypothetical protein
VLDGNTRYPHERLELIFDRAAVVFLSLASSCVFLSAWFLPFMISTRLAVYMKGDKLMTNLLSCTSRQPWQHLLPLFKCDQAPYGFVTRSHSRLLVPTGVIMAIIKGRLQISVTEHILFMNRMLRTRSCDRGCQSTPQSLFLQETHNDVQDAMHARSLSRASNIESICVQKRSTSNPYD